MTNILILSSLLFTNTPSWVTFETTNGTMRMLRTVVEIRELAVIQRIEERFTNPVLVPAYQYNLTGLTNTTAVATNKLTNMVKVLKK